MKNTSRQQFLKLSAVGATAEASQASAMSILQPPIRHRNVNALVIGSGFGSAVSGLRLVEAGVQTLVLGETIYGNNNGCKKTLLDSYLKPALDTGNLEISPLTEVNVSALMMMALTS